MEHIAETQDFGRVSGLAWQGVNYFCTTRRGGGRVGAGAGFNLAQHTDDDRSHVAENRRRLRAVLPAEPIWLNQVHGIQVFDADSDKSQSEPPVADAAVTTQSGRVLAIMTADCLPVVIADMRGRAVAVAHAGWRGLAGGVLEQTMNRLQSRLPQASDWRAWVGPAISQRNFEVGVDVFTSFTREDSSMREFFVEKVPGTKWLADLPGLARRRLHQAGVSSVELSGYCTYDRDDYFYSYRRNRDIGRMATLAWLSDSQ